MRVYGCYAPTPSEKYVIFQTLRKYFNFLTFLLPRRLSLKHFLEQFQNTNWCFFFMKLLQTKWILSFYSFFWHAFLHFIRSVLIRNSAYFVTSRIALQSLIRHFLAQACLNSWAAEPFPADEFVNVYWSNIRCDAFCSHLPNLISTRIIKN